MINFLKLFVLCKSRFCFNLNFIELIKLSFLYLFDHKHNYSNNIKSILRSYYPDSKVELFNHGRSALYCILKSISNISSKRKKIIINSLTLFEVINVIIYSGFEPIFLDCKNQESFETEAENLISKYQNEIKAVIITHLNGANTDILKVKKKLNEINSKNIDNDRIYLIEDCAVTFGAKLENKFLGEFGDYSFLSFNIMKNITSITGGALIDNFKKNKLRNMLEKFYYNNFLDLIKKYTTLLILYILNSRIIFPLFFIFIKIAHKFKIKIFLKKYRTDFELKIEKEIPKDYVKKMSNFQAYLLKHQFYDLINRNIKRINNSKYLFENLKNNKDLSFPQKDFTNKNIYLDYPILCKNENFKDHIWKKSLEEMIDIKNYYYTNCGNHEIYNKFFLEDNINSEKISKNILMLPVNINQNKKDLDRIIQLFD